MNSLCQNAAQNSIRVEDNIQRPGYQIEELYTQLLTFTVDHQTNHILLTAEPTPHCVPNHTPHYSQTGSHMPEYETVSVSIKFLVMLKKTATKNLQYCTSGKRKREQLL